MKRINEASCRCTVSTSSIAASILLVAAILAGDGQGAHRLVGQEEAARLGLKRAWFTQVRVNPARHRVERAVLENDRLTVLTTAGLVQELNALTGHTLWIAPVGNENYPSLGPAASEKFVALVNGSTLYVLDRKDGKPVIIRSVGGAPGAGPALAQNDVFVPLVSGKMEAYPLGKQTLTPWYYQSFGKAMVAPLATAESVVWTTDAGYLYVANSNHISMRYRLETGSDIVAPPAYQKPFVYVASQAGEVFAMSELSGARNWKYATGFPVTRAPAAVGGRVYVTSDQPALHCIDANTGTRVWEAPHVVQFAAASKDRVYGVTDLGMFVVLNGVTGATLGRVATERPIRALVNDQTDWVYLVSDEGMVECLHEASAKTPLYHNPKPVEPEKKAAPAEKSATPTATKPTTAPEKAPARKAAPAEEKAKGGEEKKPEKKSDTGTDENPFG
jgi:outer membrane protein assembly factor BamB